MIPNKNKRSLWNSGLVGVVIFGFCCLFRFAPPVLLIFGLLAPGIIYSILIIGYLPNLRYPLLFGILSTGIYVGCFFITTMHRMEDLVILGPLASLVGALSLMLSYALFSDLKMDLYRSLIHAALVGVLGGLPVAVFGHLMEIEYYDSNSIAGNLCFFGIFLAFPIWQILFSLALLNIKYKQVTDTYERS